MKLFRLSAAVLALAAGSAFAQTQPIPGAVQANGQPANVQGTAIVVAPSGGGAGRGVVVAADRPLPVTCVTGCSGGGGGSGAVATAAAPSYVEGATVPLSTDLSGNLRTTGGGGGSSGVKATAAAPTYVEGSTGNPVSANLTGDQRVIAKQSGTWVVDTLTTLSTVTNPVGIKGANGTGIASNANPVPVGVQGTVPVSGTFWQATQPVSGTITANLGTIGTAATAANQSTGNVSLNSIDTKLSSQATAANQTAVQGTFGSLLANRSVVYDAAGSAIDWTAPVPVTDNGGSLTVDGTVSLGAGSAIIGKFSQVDSSGADITDTVNDALRVNVVAGGGSGVAQGSTTAGQTGNLTQAAVTTADPSYTTAQTSPLSLTTTGRLRTDTTGTVIAAGSVANNTAAAGFVVPIGGEYNTTPAAITSGNRANWQMDSRGSGKVSICGNNSFNCVTSSSPGDGVTNASIGGLSTVAYNSLWNGSTHNRQLSIDGAVATGVGVAAVANAPTSAAAGALTPTVVYSTSNNVFKASAGNVYSVSLKAGATAGLLMVFNSTTVPADGAVTPQACYPVAVNETFTWDAAISGIPERFTTGISVAFSTGTSCVTKAAQSAEMIKAKFQ